MNLEEFFEESDADENRRNNRMMSFIFGMPSSGSQNESRRLSKRRPLKFISDLDTNTILVQGADEQQLQTIADLIKLYDVPEPVSSQSTRITKLFPIRYSRAGLIAETVKDAYRDLLSDNDKALQKNTGGNQSQRPSSGMTIMNLGFGDEDAESPRTSVRFKGKLSIGVDDVTNTLLVSAEGESLMTVVAGMIEALDEAAKPVSQLRVVTLKSGTDGGRIQDVLNKMLANQPPQAAANQRGGALTVGRPTGRRQPGRVSRARRTCQWWLIVGPQRVTLARAPQQSFPPPHSDSVDRRPTTADEVRPGTSPIADGPPESAEQPGWLWLRKEPGDHNRPPVPRIRRTSW